MDENGADFRRISEEADMGDQDTKPPPNTGMGGAGSGGDSATGTGAPPGAGGAGGQPIEPVVKNKKPHEARSPAAGAGAGRAHGADETGDVTGSPRVGAAGAREDSEAGGTSAQESAPDTRDTMSKAAESIIGSIVGDREPGEAPPPQSIGRSGKIQEKGQ
jgi:hypothetical protein